MSIHEAARIFGDGGPVMWPLLLLFLLTLAIAGENAYANWIAGEDCVPLLVARVEEGLRAGSAGEALRAIDGLRGPPVTLARAALVLWDRPLRAFDRTLATLVLQERSRLGRNVWALALIANIAPILGFLGTVFGMIVVFDAVVSDAFSFFSDIARGVSTALATTALGLAISVVATPLHDVFARRARRREEQLAITCKSLLELHAMGPRTPTLGIVEKTDEP